MRTHAWPAWQSITIIFVRHLLSLCWPDSQVGKGWPAFLGMAHLRCLCLAFFIELKPSYVSNFLQNFLSCWLTTISTIQLPCVLLLLLRPYSTCFVTTIFTVKWVEIILLGWYRPWIEDRWIPGLRILQQRHLSSWGCLSSRHGTAFFVLGHVVCLSNGSSPDCVQFCEFCNSQLTVQLSVLFSPIVFWLHSLYPKVHDPKHMICTVSVFLLSYCYF